MTTHTRPFVLIESPYAHKHPQGRRLHSAYLELCLYDSITVHHETPVATHKLYTLCLDDDRPGERELGMHRLNDLMVKTDYHVVYYDLGISSGMRWGIEYGLGRSKQILCRSLYSHPIPDELLRLTKET